MFFAISAIYEHVETGKIYILDDPEAMYKEEDGSWTTRVIYRDPETTQQYIRTPENFQERFEYVGYR
jgi:hypothetical protein